MIASTNNIFGGSKKRGLGTSSGITVQAASPSNNLVIAQSDGSYTIDSTSGAGYVTSADPGYTVGVSGGQLILEANE